jgi:hypothetical protein
MRNSHWLMLGIVVVVVIAAAWTLFPRKVRNDHEGWRVQQEQQAERKRNPPISNEPPVSTKSSGAGSASDSGRGETGVPTGTTK